VTVKLRETEGAAAYLESPGWSARIVHVPLASSVMVAPFAPDAVQIDVVVETNVTMSPDDAVAATLNGVRLNFLFAMTAKEIVWPALEIVKLRLTRAAAA
jgi:hypothetical protein